MAADPDGGARRSARSGLAKASRTWPEQLSIRSMVAPTRRMRAGSALIGNTGLDPSAASDRCSAAVHEFTATQCFAPTYSASSFSNCLVWGPVVIQPDRTEFVDDDQCPRHAGGPDQMVEDGRLATAEKAGQHRHGNTRARPLWNAAHATRLAATAPRPAVTCIGPRGFMIRMSLDIVGHLWIGHVVTYHIGPSSWQASPHPTPVCP